MTRTLLIPLAAAVVLAGCGVAGPGVGATTDEPDSLSGGETGGGLPATGARFGVINARIRNFTDQWADVTLRFARFDQTVRLTVLRVPANASTNVIGPEEVDLLEISGVAEDGTPLPEAGFRYGLDFFEGTEAVYLIGTELATTTIPPALIFLEPIEDVEVAAGDELAILIADEDPDSSATIDFYLDPIGIPADQADAGTAGAQAAPASVFGFDGDEVALAAGLPEDLDGEGDSFSLTVPVDLAPGDYRLAGVITDELATSIVRAPATVKVTEPSDSLPPGEEQNEAPALELVEPVADGEVPVGEALAVSWSDDDPDDNALISIFLDPNESTFDGDEFPIALDIEEDLDDGGDAIEIIVADVPPGTYRIIGLIGDGTSSSAAVAPGRVTVTAVTANEPPTIALTEPAADVTVVLGGTLTPAWEDDDANDSAQIGLYLDLDKINLNGNEVFLATFDEDGDGAGFDDGEIGIADLDPGTYYLLAVIDDGEFLGFARAAGKVTVVAAEAPGG